MIKRLASFFFLLTFFVSVAQKNYPQDYFSSPLTFPLYLSGTFGELRGNHFHSGIDIKTQGREGLPVLAAANGQVYRVKISPYGFGNALYISHGNGYNSVYAHLQSFHPKIEAYIRKAQYEQERFDVEVFPGRDMFAFKQGDTIALSGNSGGSGGPHLHFEIRNARNENIINPLLFGLQVEDNIAPKLNYLQVYTFNGKELESSEQRRVLKQRDGTYSLSGDNTLEFSDGIAFGVNVYDNLNGAPNKNGPYQILLAIDNVPKYQFTAETFAFDETRYINSHIDYPRKQCCRQVINRLYLEPGNELSMYGKTDKMNVFTQDDDTVHQVSIEISDLGGNVTQLNFLVEKIKGFETSDKAETPVLAGNMSKFLYSQTNFFKNEEVQFALPEGALYNDVLFEYSEENNCAECLTPTYVLGDIGIPVQKYYTLKIKIPERLRGNTEKLCVISVRDNGNIADFEGSRWENGYLTARTRQLGGFALARDTKPPALKAINVYEGKDVSRQANIKCSISDNLSGVEEYRATVDGKWVLMNYDAKNNVLILDLEKEQLSAGLKEFLLVAKDKLGNESRLRLSLTF